MIHYFSFFFFVVLSSGAGTRGSVGGACINFTFFFLGITNTEGG